MNCQASGYDLFRKRRKGLLLKSMRGSTKVIISIILQHGLLPDLLKRYKRIHPGCTNKEIMDLVNAIKENKYWNVLSNNKDLVYVIALNRAQIKVNAQNVVRVTYFGKISVDRDIARYCSRGKVVLALRENSNFNGRYVITWPAFLNIMRNDPELFYQALNIKDIKVLIGVKQAHKIMNE